MSTKTQEDLVPIRANGRVFIIDGVTYEPDKYDIVNLPRAALPDVRDYAFSLRPEVAKLAADKQSHFGGRLVRWGKDTWSWCDGVPEPKVSDLTLNDLYPELESRFGPIEVPVALAAYWPELRWVVNGEFPEADSQSDVSWSPQQPGAFARRILCCEAVPKVYLVPRQVWKEHNEANCLGPVWEQADDSRIRQRAALLGFKKGEA